MMKLNSPRQVTLLMSAVIALIAALLLALIYVIGLPALWVLPAGVIVLFFVCFFILRYWLNDFVYNKIDPIYRTIHAVSQTRSEFIRDFDNVDVVQEDVIDWAGKKKLEIDQLKQMEKYRKEFVGNVSHELKTPIFNIQGYILTLLEGGLDDPAINRLYLERTEKSINRMITIVQDLESISRLESGDLKLLFETFNLVNLVEEVYEGQELRAREREIRLTVKNPGDRPVMVYADKLRIFEALNNLVVNSINYGKKNGKTTISFTEMGENILVEVSDNGIGISEKDIPRVFERFYRVDKSRSRNMGGTGLGLAIVKHIIEAHNQTLNVRSRPDEGTVFGFTLKKG